MLKRRLYLQDFIGLANRLEALALAFALRAAHGHGISLDWPELDAFSVADTCRGAPGIWGRLGAVRVRQCSKELFEQLKQSRKIILRGVFGPEEELQAVYPTLPGKLHLASPLQSAIQSTFTQSGSHPVVGVHVRGGDFAEGDPEIYDATAHRHPAVPLWWYEHAMELILAQAPETRFLLCCTGDSNLRARWQKRFRIIAVPAASPYTYKGPDHASVGHRSPTCSHWLAVPCCWPHLSPASRIGRQMSSVVPRFASPRPCGPGGQTRRCAA